ncbi:MAG: rhodanese-like domain-containing protein [Bernardetiaceae bacterium]
MEDITAQELKERLEGGETIRLIDVRETYEYEEDNLGGQLVPLGELSSRLDDFSDWKEEEVIVHCRSGARSANAKQYMSAQGFAKVRNLLGGIMAYRRLS